MDLYGSLFRKVLLPAWESGVRRRPTLKYQASLERTQWASLDELQSMQSDALRRLVAHAYQNVPFFRARMQAASISPADIVRIDDVTKMAIVYRDELRDTLRLRGSIAPPFPTVQKSTSGTMGDPLVFGYDIDSDHWRIAVKARGYGWAGYEPGEPSVHYWGSSAVPYTGAKLLKVRADRAMKRETYVDCGSRADAQLANAVRVLREVQPRALVCYAQAGADLARYIVEKGEKPFDSFSVLCGAERLYPSDRELMTRAFGPRIFETYGCREVMLVASECDAHAGLHESMENILVEVVVRENGRERPAAPGEVGEVVVTDLHNYGMPFLRYANGDLAVRMPDGVCACGRALRRLERIEGRVTETLRDGKGGRVSGLIFSIVFVTLADALRQFQAVQRLDGSLLLRIVPTSRWGESSRTTLLGMTDKYLAGVPVTIELCEDIPVSRSGKRQIVIVEQEPGASARRGAQA